MRIIKPNSFKGINAWDALDIERIGDASIRLHWTDQPYTWHVNDGPEIFVVLDGEVDMHVRDSTGEKVHLLGVGDIFHAQTGDEHVAHPRGASRVLVIEKAGSI